MEKFPEMYELGINLYNKYLDNLSSMYLYCKDRVTYEKEELINDFNKYLEALLIKVMIADKLLQNMEFAFINYVLKTDLSMENVDKIDYEATLKKVPLFVELSVKCDKKMDEALKVIEPTYSQMTYDFLRRFPTYFKFVDGHVPNEEDVEAKAALAPVVEYYKKSYVRYAPRRKEKENE